MYHESTEAGVVFFFFFWRGGQPDPTISLALSDTPMGEMPVVCSVPSSVVNFDSHVICKQFRGLRWY